MNKLRLHLKQLLIKCQKNERIHKIIEIISQETEILTKKLRQYHKKMKDFVRHLLKNLGIFQNLGKNKMAKQYDIL